MDDKPRRPWWLRKRWLAAAVATLLAAYVASEGPFQYAVVRGWIPPSSTIGVAFQPTQVVRRVPVLGRGHTAYLRWWYRLGVRHDPPYKIDGPFAGREVAVRSDEYCVANVEEKLGWHRVYLAGRYFVAVSGDRIAIGDAQEGWEAARAVAEVPADAERVTIEYFGGRLDIEIDGRRVYRSLAPAEF